MISIFDVIQCWFKRILIIDVEFTFYVDSIRYTNQRYKMLHIKFMQAHTQVLNLIIAKLDKSKTVQLIDKLTVSVPPPEWTESQSRHVYLILHNCDRFGIP